MTIFSTNENLPTAFYLLLVQINIWIFKKRSIYNNYHDDTNIVIENRTLLLFIMPPYRIV